MNHPLKTKSQISTNQLVSWGMIRQVKREEIIDNYLQEIPFPEKNQIESLTQEWCNINRINSLEILNEWKMMNGFDDQQWTYFIVRKWRWINWCMKNFQNQISPYYLERKSMLDKVTYSLIRIKNKNLANELYLRIKERESTFSQIAAKYSQGPERNTGGLIGPVPIGKAHPTLSNLLLSSQKGQLWSPRKIDNWWVIFRLEKLEAIPLDEKTTLRLVEELGEKHLKKNIDEYMKKNFNFSF